MIATTRPRTADCREAVRRWMEADIQFVGAKQLAKLADAGDEFIALPTVSLAKAPSAASKRDPSAPYLTSMLSAELLRPEQETELFRAMNLSKFRAFRLQKKLTLNAPCKRLVTKIERWMQFAGEVRNQIVAANVRLVVSVAKKFAGYRHPLAELISDGNLTLIRAVEKFDYSRGFRFSTYATWALRYNFARTVGKKPSLASLSQTGDEQLNDLADTRDDLLQERNLAEGNRVLDRMLAKLDPREHAIMLRRFGLEPGCEEGSLQEIGRELGVCKERVRQLQLRAFAKLKAMAADLRLEQFETI